jgi:DmsE family decaheme c-type cytochrome
MAFIGSSTIMNLRSRGFPVSRLVVALALAWAAVIGLASAGSPPDQQSAVSAVNVAPVPTRATAPPATQVPQPASGFVGDDTCTACHEPEGTSLRASLHGKAQNPRTPAGKAGQACESCHGPGQAHVDTGDKTKIKRFASMSARDANATCLTCHNKGAHSDFQGSMHDARNVSCVSCHRVHDPKSEKAQLKTVSITQTCESCHKQEAMKVKKLNHMPLPEGKMECTSCHSPHGSNNVRMLKAGNTINEACESCHTEKRGPFLWEHSAGKENCASCHDPHGSSNDRMLVAKAPMLCQRCHVSSRHPATVYDGAQLANSSNRLVGRGCVNCHSQIHGSNHPAGNRFLR